MDLLTGIFMNRVKKKDKMLYHCILYCSRDAFKVFVAIINTFYSIFPVDYYTVLQGSKLLFHAQISNSPTLSSGFHKLFTAHLNTNERQGVPWTAGTVNSLPGIEACSQPLTCPSHWFQWSCHWTKELLEGRPTTLQVDTYLCFHQYKKKPPKQC